MVNAGRAVLVARESVDHSSNVTISSSWSNVNRKYAVRVGRVCMLDVQVLYPDAIPQDNQIPFGFLPAQLRPAKYIELAINFFDAGSRIACGLLIIEASGSMSVKAPYDPNTGWRWVSGTVTYLV